MRKRYWVLIAFLALGGIGNLIGGTDTPVRGAVDPGERAAGVMEPVVAPFDATVYVAASSLNLRAAPGSSGQVLASLPRNTRVMAGERRAGWVQVSANGVVGWVSDDYLAAAPVQPAPSEPKQSKPREALQEAEEASCPSRRYCKQIASCEEARYYLANCSWGGLLDADNDGVPCESICR